MGVVTMRWLDKREIPEECLLRKRKRLGASTNSGLGLFLKVGVRLGSLTSIHFPAQGLYCSLSCGKLCHESLRRNVQ